VFDDWHAAGPDADRMWQEYHQERGFSFRDTLRQPFVLHAFDFDMERLEKCEAGVLVLPAGKSAHGELGFLAGQGKPTYILLDGEPEKFDLMYLLHDKVCYDVSELLEELRKCRA
jgi:hypothetical protein